ncbi:MAG: hypothetical protein RR419_08795 [Akkermansia sp.]
MAITIWNIDFNGSEQDNLITEGWNNISLNKHKEVSSYPPCLIGDTQLKSLAGSDRAVSNITLKASFSGSGYAGPGDGIALDENTNNLPLLISGIKPVPSVWRDSICISQGVHLTMTFSGLTAGEYSLTGFCGMKSSSGTGLIEIANKTRTTLDQSTQSLDSGSHDNVLGTAINFDSITVGTDGNLTFTVTCDSGSVALNYLTLTQKEQSIPEPPSVFLGLVAFCGMLLHRQRSHKR